MEEKKLELKNPVEKPVVKIKEYDEIICRKCKKVLKVKDTLEMVDGYHGICTCPECGHRNKVVKTRPADADYNRLPTGQRVRKIPKDKLTKK